MILRKKSVYCVSQQQILSREATGWMGQREEPQLSPCSSSGNVLGEQGREFALHLPESELTEDLQSWSCQPGTPPDQRTYRKKEMQKQIWYLLRSCQVMGGRQRHFSLCLQNQNLTLFRQHNGAKEKPEQHFLKRNLSK